MMTDQQKLDVVAVGAHPDDIEIACGGTLARLAELGHAVAIIDLTNGEPTPLCEDPAIRVAEAHAAAETLGVQRIILDLPNRRLFDNFESRVALATELRRYRPDLVIGLGGRTPMASPDHWQAMQITDAAVFYSQLTKWDEHFAGIPPHKIRRQLHCQLSFEVHEGWSRGAPIVMDISETLEQKVASVRCYKTQFPPEKEYIFRRVRSFAEHAGEMAGFAAGEVFVAPRPVGVQDLMEI